MLCVFDGLGDFIGEKRKEKEEKRNENHPGPLFVTKRAKRCNCVADVVPPSPSNPVIKNEGKKERKKV